MTLKEAVGKVLEGWTLPNSVRKILEEAYFAAPQRTWEGLSVFEINDLVTNTEHGLHELVERTEKLLEEKNT